MSVTSRAAALLLLAACGGGDRVARSDTTAMATTPPPTEQPSAVPADTTMRAEAKASPAAAPATTADTAHPAPASAQRVALGDSIFHGQVAGGTCTACHGQDAKGTAIAPNLTDGEWLNGDGSYEFIVATVANGVAAPKQHPAPMPPKGGATLTDDQVKAVAAYVYSLSHRS